ncbi:MAG: hypothetical protein KF799_09815 [Bdellovibrionales bacterium]|nr:hypothetical protein [Bdellovibrionales bacterium]
MELRDYSPTKKALQVNLDDTIYGTFAEIGAGQEVARHFFQAGRASHTIAKTISAYDMTFSDEIYGKAGRYVCEERVVSMLDYEFGLLQERLRAKRGSNTRFFAFANTVATASSDEELGKSHGWMGVRFQVEPGGAYNDIILHVKLWDRFRLQQQETLGILGVNLIHMAFFPPEKPEDRIAYLIEALNTKRVEVNMIRFRGPDLQHLDNRLMSLELVKSHLTEAVMFDAKSQVQHVGDALFRKAVLVQRGTYRPITSSNLEIAHKVTDQFKRHPLLEGAEPKVLFEITMNSLTGDAGAVDDEDFLHRVDTLTALGQEVLVSNFSLFYQMKSFLRQYTDRAIGIVVGASLLPKMFDEQFYKELPGGILEGMSRLFDDKTRMFVYPFKDDTLCSTAKTFNPEPKLQSLYKYLTGNEMITDILQCDDIDTSVHSSDVREMLAKRDPQWINLVPPEVRKLIEERQLFGYRP